MRFLQYSALVVIPLWACSSGNGDSGSHGSATGGNENVSSSSERGGATNGTMVGSSTQPGSGGFGAAGGQLINGGGTQNLGGGPQNVAGTSAVGGGSDVDEPETCAALDATSHAAPPILEFVVDITGSMNDRAYPMDPSEFASKWDEMARVLPSSLRSLPADWAVGLSFFNFAMEDRQGCFAGDQAVAINPLTSSQLNAIDDVIAMQQPDAATPTYQAWKFGLGQISAWVAPPAYASSARYVVLITDGIPTINNDGCNGDGSSPISEQEYDDLISRVKSEGESAKVGTFVVGVLGSDNPQGASYDPLYKLSQIAVAGGTEQPKGCVPKPGTPSWANINPRGSYCHFDMTTNPDFAAGLTEALKSISTQILSCSYEVPTPADGRIVNPNRVVVTIADGSGTTTALKKATDAACADGDWYYSAFDANGRPTKLELCTDACANARRQPGQASLKVTFTCYDIG